MIVEEESGLTLEIDKNNFTAKVINSPKCNGHVFIPRSIIHDSKEYIITTIASSFGENTEITMVDFPQNSEVETIESYAYKNFKNYSLSLPPKIKEIKYNWQTTKFHLDDVSISPDNKNFKFLDDMLLGKSDITRDCFDIIFLASYSIEYANIPPYIKKISPYAFYHCGNLKYVKFSENSELEIIGKKSFSDTKISKITIPKSVKIIEKKSFEFCSNLREIEFEENSEIKSISEKVFSSTKINHFCIPEKVERLENKWCFYADNLSVISVSPKNKNFKEIENKMIVGKSNIESEIFDTLFFVPKNEKNVVIPSYIKRINSYAFAYNEIINVKFEVYSQLEIIDQYAFYQSKINEIIIPKSVKIISKCSFSKCNHLKKVEFEENSKLEIIGVNAFSNSSINQIIIPKNVMNICKNAFNNSNLQNVSFSEDSELRFIGKGAFQSSSIKNFVIPKNVRVIKEETFKKCRDLLKVTTEEGSELEEIEKSAFYGSNIKVLELSKKISKLRKGWCDHTDSLTEVIIPTNNSHFKVNNNEIIYGKSNINEEESDDDYESDESDVYINDEYDEYEEDENYNDGKEEFNEQDKDNENDDDDDETKENNYDAIYFVSRNIEEINIPDNIKQIKSYAFSGCNIKNIELIHNNKLEELCTASFSRSSLTSIFLPKHIKFIGNSCFCNCHELADIKFSDESELQIIGKYAFSSTQISDITIPKSVTNIKKGAFSCCKFIKTFRFPKEINLHIISEKMFNDSLLSCISIPKSVQIIKKEAFARCEQLNSFDIPEDSELITIEEDAFEYCNIEIFNVPSQLIECDFRSIDGIKEIHVSPNNKYFSVFDDKLILSKSDINNEYYDILCFVINGIKHVNIPSHVKIIKSNAFCNYKLDTLVFSEDLEIIDDNAFHNAELPNKIVIPKHVKRIGKYAFCQSKLKTIEFEEDSELQIIDDYAFKESSLCQIILPSKVKYIGMSAFEDSSIESINIPKYIEIINDDTFRDCIELKKVEFVPDSQLKLIGIHSFYNCPFNTISIPDHVQDIKFQAFYDCMNLESVLFTENSEIQRINDNTFSRISSLFIPPKLKELVNEWCLDLSLLTNISISPNNEYFALIDGKYFVSKSKKENKEYDILYCVLNNNNNVIIPSYIKRIANCAFAYKSDIESIEISTESKLEIIDDYSFYESSIKSIFIPKHVKIIGYHAFGSSLIETIEFGEESELYIIKSKAFEECKIKDICLPQHVQFIESYAFCNTDIKSFVFPKDTIYEDFVVFNECQNLHEIVFSDEAKFIEYFDDYDEAIDVEKINIPPKIDDLGFISGFNGLKIISVSPKNKYFKDIDKKMIVKKSDINKDQFDILFFAVQNIKNVVIPSDIKFIEERAFEGCKKINKIEFQENSELENIKSSAFRYSSITEIKIPKHTKKIGEGAFFECKNLQKIEFDENSELEFIGADAFYKSKITGIIIPNSVKIIDDRAFASCHDLIKIDFSNNSKLVKIGKGAFKNSSIRNFVIPKNVRVIKEETFKKCHDLLKVTTEEGSELEEIEKSAFYGSNIKVLELSKKISKLRKGWCDHTDSLTEVIIPTNNSHFKVNNNHIIYGKSNINEEESDDDYESDESNAYEYLYSYGDDQKENEEYKDGNYKIEEFNEQDKEKDNENENDDDETKENNYDAIYFVSRNIEEINIPDNIKQIKPYAFSGCNIKNIELIHNNKLEELCTASFSRSSLTSIFLPKHIKFIGNSCLKECNDLFNIEIDQESKAIIKYDAFGGTPIRGFIIPKGINLYDSMFLKDCPNLCSIEILNDDEIATNLKFKFIENVSIVSFPNARNIVIECNQYDIIDKEEDLIVFVSHHACFSLIDE